MLNHYRNIKRKHFDHQVVEDFVKVASNREKRAVEDYRGRRMFEVIERKREAIKMARRRRSIEKRDSRDYGEIDRAYSKYYEKIKARYRNYVKNLFPNPKIRSTQLNNSYPMQSAEEVKNTKKIQVQDGRWYNSYSNPEFRYRATHKARTFSNDLQNEEYENEMGPPIALPSITDPTRLYKHNETVSNYYPSYVNSNDRHYAVDEAFESLKKIQNSTNIAADVYAQLQTQMVRKKRETDEDSKGDRSLIDLRSLCFHNLPFRRRQRRRLGKWQEKQASRSMRAFSQS